MVRALAENRLALVSLFGATGAVGAAFVAWISGAWDVIEPQAVMSCVTLEQARALSAKGVEVVEDFQRIFLTANGEYLTHTACQYAAAPLDPEAVARFKAFQAASGLGKIWMKVTSDVSDFAGFVSEAINATLAGAAVGFGVHEVNQRRRAQVPASSAQDS